MEGEEPAECCRGYVVSSSQDMGDGFADKRKSSRHRSHDGCRPVAELGPGEEMAAETEDDNKKECQPSPKPGQFPGPFIISHEEDDDHVQEDDPDHQVAAHGVHFSEQPAIGDLGHDILHTLEGVVGVGYVIDKQEDAGHCLDDERNDGDKSEGIEDIDVLRGCAN